LSPGGTCSFTATFVSLPGYTGISGRKVGFFVTSGPNAGRQSSTTSPLTTDVNGNVTFSYIGGSGVGQDLISVFLDDSNYGVRDPCECVTTNICNWGATIVKVTAPVPDAYENPWPPARSA
jgi:hypothetical protein